MPLYKIYGKKVTKIPTKDLDLEKHLQRLFEDNLVEILDICFLAHEYPTSFGGRMDTLGIDGNGAPCIIEYKRSRNDSVINQGLSYLRWLLDHKAEFEVICRTRKISVEVDWSSPRVICIAESYNKFDLDTADFLPINVELLRYRIYKENILLVEPEIYQKINVQTSTLVNKYKNREKNQILQRSYTLDEHLKGKDTETVELFQALRDKILSLDQNIREEPKSKYVAYKLSTNFTDITILQKVLIVYINVKSGQLRDSHKLARDLTRPKKMGHWGNGDYDIRVTRETPLNEVFDLIKQSYDLYK